MDNLTRSSMLKSRRKITYSRLKDFQRTNALVVFELGESVI